MEEKQQHKSHRLLLNNRRTGTVSGVTDVISFDIAEILLETEQGMLTIKGADLHVNRLTLEKGEVDIEGRIDGIRIFRRVIPHGTVAVALEDILYWLICGISIFRMLYVENSGAIRGFAIAAVVLGMLLYLQFTKLLKKIGKKLQNSVREGIMYGKGRVK